MKNSLLLLLALGFFSAGQPASRGDPAGPGPVPRKIKVFILAGQSNMEGKGDGSKFTAEEKALLASAQTHVQFAYNHQPIRPLDVVPAGGNKKRFGVDFTFGPEMFFGLRLAAAWPDEPILLIKRSVGATSLYGRWNPDWTEAKAAKMNEAKASPLYADFMGYVREVLAAYDPSRYEICGMLWVQGEADGNAKAFGPEPGAEYGNNLQNLIAHVRHDTGVPDLPVLFVQVGADPVVAGMRQTAKTGKNVEFIPQSKDPAASNFFPTYPVGHYNYEGQKRIGTLLADAYLSNYAARVRGPSAEPINQGLRVFTCGHSFHAWVAPMLADLAAKAGIAGHQVAGVSSIGGSRVAQHWDVPVERNQARKLLEAGSVDVLTLSPIWMPDEGIEEFAQLGFAHNQKLRVTVQEFWLPNDTYHPVYPLEVGRPIDHNATNLTELRRKNDLYRHDVEAEVDKVNLHLGHPVVFVVPVGEAAIELRERIVRGKARPIKVQWTLFMDTWGHPAAPLRVLAAYCHFAVVYRRSPVGLPMPEELIKNHDFASPDLNRLLQEVAWNAVINDPHTGVTVADNK